MGIETIIGAAVAAAAAGLQAAGLATAAAIISLVGTLAAVAFQVLGANRAQRTDAQREERTRQFDPHPPFRFAFGEVPIEGSVAFHYAKGQKYYLTLLLNSVPSHAIDAIEINDGIPLPLLSDASNDLYDMAKGAGTSESTYSAAVRFWAGLGEQTAPPSSWLTDIPGVIQSSDSWSGATVLHIEFTHGNQEQALKRWAQGKPPPIRVYGRWSKVYDPRLDSSSGVTGASGSHDPADRTTWAYSANPALCALMLVRDDRALAFDDEMIPIQQWADAADACEVDAGSTTATNVLSTPWTGASPAAQVVGSDAGSGVWTHNRGTVATATGTLDANTGNPVLKLTSTDTDGTLIPAEYARAGVYIDLGSDGPHDITRTEFFTGTTGQGRLRYKIYQADTGGAASSTDQEDTFMPPTAANITLVYDRGDVGFPGGAGDVTHTINGRYASMVVEGGAPNQGFIEMSAVSWTSSTDYGQRFECHGVVAVREREFSILDPVLGAMAGWLDTTDGLLGVRAGVWAAATGALSQPVGDEIEIKGRRDGGLDKVTPKIIGEHRNFEETDGPQWPSPDAPPRGARDYPLQLPMVKSPYQAQHLAKIFFNRSEPNRTVSATFDGREMSRRIGERVTLALPGFNRADATYLIDAKQTTWQPEADGVRLEVKLTLIEDKETNWTFTPDEYDVPESYVPPAKTVPTIAAPTGCELTTEERTVPGEGAETELWIRQRFLPVSTADSYVVTVTEAQYDTVGNENETVGPTTFTFEVDAGQTIDDGGTEKVEHYFGPVIPNVQYDFSVVAGSASLGRSDTALECNITPAPDAAPTGVPTLISSSHDGVHTATHTLQQTTEETARQIRLYGGNESDRSDLTLLATASALPTIQVGLADVFAFADIRYLRAKVVDKWQQESPNHLDFDYTPAGSTQDALLKEDGANILTEAGDAILLE